MQRGLGELPGLRGVQRQRLLDQHVLARLDRGQRAREMLVA